MQKVNTAYLLCDDRKFDTIDKATKELKRLRALCYRLKDKNVEKNIAFTMGVSTNITDFIGEMIYDKPKNKGGKKQFVCYEKITKRDRNTGEKYKYKPSTECLAHIHIMINGYGASSYAERILLNLRVRNKENKFRKRHLKTDNDSKQAFNYIKAQSTVFVQVK